MHRSSRLQSTNCTRAPARIAASGVAMNVFDGHSTVSPSTPAKSSAASAPPAQLDSATAGSPFHASQAASKRCDHRRPPTSARSRAPRRSARAGGRDRDGRSRSRSGRSRGRSRSWKLWSCCPAEEHVRADRGTASPAGRRRISGSLANPLSGRAPSQACQTGRTVPISAAFELCSRSAGSAAAVRSVRVRARSRNPRRAGGSRRRREVSRWPGRRSAPGVVNLRQSLPQRDHSSGSQARRARGLEPGGAVDPVRGPVPGDGRRRSRPRSRPLRAPRSSRHLRAASRGCSRWR